MSPDDATRDSYLARLGLEAEPPSVDALFRLHRAQVERVPYETLWIQLGDGWGIDPTESFRRIATPPRGGYCFHLNGAFSELLAALGYEVDRHVGGVHGPDGATGGEMTNHLVLTVRGLPDDANPDGTWYVDAGLGDALHEPLPLRAGTYRQDPFVLVLEETPGGVGDWHLVHDPKGGFTGMSWRSAPTDMSAFVDRHQWLSTSPESGFVRVLTAQRRDATGIDVLRGLTLRRIGSDARERTLETKRELIDALNDLFAFDMGPGCAGALDALWPKLYREHLAWEAAGRPQGLGVLTPPEGLPDETLVEVLTDAWGLAVTSLDYRAVGFGSHHWRAIDGQGKSWFVTVDDLGSKRRNADESEDASFDRLRAALTTACDLRAGGCAFVVAPIPTRGGAPLTRIDRRLAAALYPHVDGQTFSWGEFSTAAHRRAVLDMIVALHSVPAAVAPEVVRDDYAVPWRDELEASLGGHAADWDSGPYGLRASNLLVERGMKIRRALVDYDDLVAGCAADASAGRAVVTHGEPHPANTIATPEGCMLIDWDTVLRGLPERDLWSLDPGDGSIHRAYTAATGTAVDPRALALFRVRWDLCDIAVYVSHFRRHHIGTADDEKSWQELTSLVAQLA